MSSHREAPEISKDPVADNTDTYAFVSPDKPNTVTLIANFIPSQIPEGGPNFYEFGDDVLYEINISNRGKAQDDITYQFRFTTTIRNPNTFLYNTGQITNIHDAAWNRPQTYSVTRVQRGRAPERLATGLLCPPVNVGVRSTPNYAALATQAVYLLPGGRKVFAGQRGESFHVDLGSIFDLGTLRPFQNLHLIPSAGGRRRQWDAGHQRAHHRPPGAQDRSDRRWAQPNRPQGAGLGDRRLRERQPAAVQGLGRPARVAMARAVPPGLAPRQPAVQRGHRADGQEGPMEPRRTLATTISSPSSCSIRSWLGCCRCCIRASSRTWPPTPSLARDLAAILLTGIPAGVVPGFQNFTGTTQADLLRLNLAIPPAAKPNPLGLVAGDPAGFPNGRRLADDVVTVELRAIAGLTIPLVDPAFKPDGAAALIQDGTALPPASNNLPAFLSTFPYVPLPGGGYQTMPGTTSP